MKQTLKLKAAILALVGAMIFVLGAQAAPKKAKAPTPSPSPSSPADEAFFEYSPYPGFEYNTYGYGMEGGWIGKNEDLVKADLGEEPGQENKTDWRLHKTAPIGEFTVEWKGWTKPEQLRLILGATVTWWVQEGIQDLMDPTLDDYYIPMIVKVYDSARHYICQWQEIPNDWDSSKRHPLGYPEQEPWTPSAQNLKEINAAVKRASSKLVYFVLFPDPRFAGFYVNCPSWTRWGFSLWSLRKDETPSYAEAVRNSENVVATLKEKRKYIYDLNFAYANFRSIIMEDFVTKVWEDETCEYIIDNSDILMPLLPTRAIEAGEYSFINNAEKGKRKVTLKGDDWTFQSVPSELHRTGKKQFDTDFPDHIVLDVNYLRERLKLLKSRGEKPWDSFYQQFFDKYLAVVGK